MSRERTKRQGHQLEEIRVLIAAGSIALEQRICRPGWVETRGQQIHECGAGPPPRQADVDLPDALVVPGFVEMHAHGGGGGAYAAGTGADIVRAAAFPRPHGPTSAPARPGTAP